MQIAIGLLLGLGLLFWGLIAVAGALPVLSFSRVRLEPMSSDATRQALQLAIGSSLDIDPAWLRDQGMQPVGAFRARQLAMEPAIVAWQRGDEATWFCVYLVHGKAQSMDWVSLLDDRMLTTGGSRDGQLFPAAAGNWMQTFSTTDAAVLYQHHQDALDWIRANTGLVPDRSSTPFAQQVEEDLRRQGDQIRAIPLWFARIPCWYFTRRFTRHNKPVQDLSPTQAEPAF